MILNPFPFFSNRHFVFGRIDIPSQPAPGRDVFEVEPLPADSSLWWLDNVLAARVVVNCQLAKIDRGGGVNLRSEPAPSPVPLKVASIY